MTLTQSRRRAGGGVGIEVTNCESDAQKARIYNLVMDGMMNQVVNVVRRSADPRRNRSIT